MPPPRTICQTCHLTLQSSLPDILEKSLSKGCTHHQTLADFRASVAQDCFICAVLWNAIDDASHSTWERDPDAWRPIQCTLERRPWAPEQFEPIYWQFAYLVFSLEVGDLKYRGNSFCVSPTSKEGNKLYVTEQSTSSPKVLDVALDWHQVCRKSHNDCPKVATAKRFTPTRLVEIGEDTWKLRLITEDTEPPVEYMTLSYRWGTLPSIQLLSSNLDTFTTAQPIEHLPKTFREAITVARHFSINHLWIDSLCIIQDSPEDWLQESLKMHQVYAHSSCTISAAASSTPEGGLFRARDPARDVIPVLTSIDLPGSLPQHFDIWDEFYMQRHLHGPLTGRGWVFQERFLSPRVLHFADTQVLWECFEMQKCETFPRWSPYPTVIPYYENLKSIGPLLQKNAAESDDDDDDDDEALAMSHAVFGQWCNILQWYSKCAFSYADDRLVAMSGIVHLFQDRTGDEYLAGLWRSRLLEGLNWVVVDPAPRPASRRAPSWSWAAVDSPFLPKRVKFPGETHLVKVLDAKVWTPEGSVARSCVMGSIELQGSVTKATIRESGSRGSFAENIVLKLDDLDLHLYAYPDTSDESAEVGRGLHLLALKTNFVRMVSKQEETLGEIRDILEGILLEPEEGSDSTYRRIGRFVVAELSKPEIFGLRTETSKSGWKRIVLDEARASVITIV